MQPNHYELGSIPAGTSTSTCTPTGHSRSPGNASSTPEAQPRLPAFEDGPEAGPALPLALLAETPADGLYQLAGDDGGKQVTISALRGLVKVGTQAQFGFERAEPCLHVGEGARGAPQRLLVPVPDVGAQAVDAGMGEKGAFERSAFPGDGAGLVAIAFDLKTGSPAGGRDAIRRGKERLPVSRSRSQSQQCGSVSTNAGSFSPNLGRNRHIVSDNLGPKWR